MKRLTLLLLFFVSTAAFGAESWSTAYLRGLAAAQKNDWSTCAEAMQSALGQKNKEDEKARVGRQNAPYLPYYWLGIARVNLGDVTSGSDALRNSETQGAVQKTVYYTELRSALARAEAKKKTLASQGDAAAKTTAEEAVRGAMTRRFEATAAGALRQENFRRGAQKLQEAFDAQKSGSFQRATQLAGEASQMFGAATAEEKRRRASAGADAPAVARNETETRHPSATTRAEASAAAQPMKQEPLPSLPVTEPAGERESVATRGASATESGAATSVATQPTRASTSSSSDRAALGAAFAEWKQGRFDRAESLLTKTLTAKPALVDALMLRGCARYTQAVLTANRALEKKAADDFRAALRLAPSAHLDKRLFSPKLVRFFEGVRASS